jgi:hypothetical protein
MMPFGLLQSEREKYILIAADRFELRDQVRATDHLPPVVYPYSACKDSLKNKLSGNKAPNNRNNDLYLPGLWQQKGRLWLSQMFFYRIWKLMA